MVNVTPGVPSPEESERDRKFQLVFGISKEELRTAGIDPDAYMGQHIHEALKNPQNQKVLLPQSTIIRLQYFKEAQRVYVWLFATLGVLLLSALFHGHSTKQLVVYLSIFPFAAAAWEVYRQIQTARLYRRTCRDEGISTPLYGRRLS